jgi:iron-sulfur cluster assembly protein
MSGDFVPISITQRAAEEIRRTLKTKNIPEGYGLRVGVKGGGCGVTPLLGFDKRKEDDQEFMIHGIPVYVNKKQTLFVVGKEIDFYDGADERGFLFR